jgi:hypothetical protein
MKWILILIWIVPGQPPSITQIPFNEDPSPPAMFSPCRTAADDIIRFGETLARDGITARVFASCFIQK